MVVNLARLTTAAVAALLLAAAPASASTVRLDPGGGDDSSTVTYTAAPGEQNKVSVAVDGPKATIDDPGASSITTQQGCTQVTPKRAVCDLQDSTTNIQRIAVELADGDDSFEMTAVNTRFSGASVRGGTGDDDLRGGPFADSLNGGVGIDALRGGAGDDFLSTDDQTGSADADLADGGEGSFDQFFAYEKRTTPVTVDLASNTPAGEAGEGDTLLGIEGTVGGQADDTILGNDGFNLLSGGPGNDLVDGREGLDSVNGGDGNDTVVGGHGEDQIEAGSGDDVIRLDNDPAVYDAYVFCGDGNDLVTGHTAALPSIGLDCERLDLGSGIVAPVLPRRVTTTYIAMSIPCPAVFRDANGVCAGKLVVEPRLSFRRSATTRFRNRYGATEFRFKTQSAKITVKLNAKGRTELRKPFMRLQFTLRLKETATGTVRQFEWTENLSRAFLKQRGVG
jgi:Ca2+-binding RTX toxin-like protein